MRRLVMYAAILLTVALTPMPARPSEWLSPQGWRWMPEGQVYVNWSNSRYMYAMETGSWMYYYPNDFGPWSWSFITSQWFHFVFLGWNYFAVIGGDYYYYNYDIGAWYYMDVGFQNVWYWNFNRSAFGLIY
jgi:hypothetical protein